MADYYISAAGGGVTNSKLVAATAGPADVVGGKTFYAGDKDQKVGTLVDQGIVTATSCAEASGNLYYRIPFGAYRTASGPDGGTEIMAAKTTVSDALGGPKCVYAGRCWANGYDGGGGATGSAYCTAGNGQYDGWLNAAVSGYFSIWLNNDYYFGWYTAGTRLCSRSFDSTGDGRVCYVYL